LSSSLYVTRLSLNTSASLSGYFLGTGNSKKSVPPLDIEVKNPSRCLFQGKNKRHSYRRRSPTPLSFKPLSASLR
jgi:hypothetical protein